MENTDPYRVLGIQQDATDEQIKAAYRELAQKYHADIYADNPLSDVAREKMQEINDAYDTIIKSRKFGGQSGYAQSYGQNTGGYSSSKFSDVRALIAQNRIYDAESILNGVSGEFRDAEWNYLKGVILQRQGWLDGAFNHYSTAHNMDPDNTEYAAAFNQMRSRRQPNSGGTSDAGNFCCNVCATYMCIDCLCSGCCRTL